jgi:hypothetical protein
MASYLDVLLEVREANRLLTSFEVNDKRWAAFEYSDKRIPAMREKLQIIVEGMPAGKWQTEAESTTTGETNFAKAVTGSNWVYEMPCADGYVYALVYVEGQNKALVPRLRGFAVGGPRDMVYYDKSKTAIEYIMGKTRVRHEMEGYYNIKIGDIGGYSMQDIAKDWRLQKRARSPLLAVES